MYNIRFDKYVPEPQPATPKTIVAAHYYAAWKKGAARIHDAFNDLAETFPDRTPLMGYYDEENPEVCDWEIKWAVEHGINCFIYCWYRNLENMGKPVTVGDLRCGHGIHEALFNARYGNMMNFAIMYEASPRWGAADEEDLLENVMPFWMETYFKRDNYLKIDNKPVLFVFNNKRLVNDFFPDPADEKRAWDRCREYCRSCGFDGMVVAVCESAPKSAEEQVQLLSRGFDFCFGYLNGYMPDHDYPTQQEIIDGQVNRFKEIFAMDPVHFIPTASCFLDTTPRWTDHWNNMGYRFRESFHVWHGTPETMRTVLHRMNEEVAKLPEDSWARKIVMIDNWNEWDEGHYVSPSVKYGFRFLQAIREEMTLRDNLPDYRTPQEIGFTGYNTSWKTPDFTDFCKKTYLD